MHHKQFPKTFNYCILPAGTIFILKNHQLKSADYNLGQLRKKLIPVFALLMELANFV